MNERCCSSAPLDLCHGWIAADAQGMQGSATEHSENKQQQHLYTITYISSYASSLQQKPCHQAILMRMQRIQPSIASPVAAPVCTLIIRYVCESAQFPRSSQVGGGGHV